MLKILLLSIALQADATPYTQLENYYWDCDTLFMKGELGGQDMWSCLSITEQFQTHFESKEDFLIYWHNNKFEQWEKRGFRPAPDFV
jgi:hypothetical protein